MGFLDKIKSKATDARLQMQQPGQQPAAQQSSPSSASSSSPFVQAVNGSLVCQGQQYRFVGLNAPELLDGDVNGPFEYWHTFASLAAEGAFGRAKVTRTYTLRVKSKNIGRAHINGWNSSWGDWEWDEERFKEIDRVLAEAAKHGVKLIIPIINNDNGEDHNWVGCTSDLIRMRKGLSSYEQTRSVDWWTDHDMIESFKLIIDKLVSRVNHVTGVKYADDPTILAWETGNEMNCRGMRPAPASWTLMVAKHLKSRAANHLVMDGSYARSEDVSACYEKEVLKSSDVDILSYHYYGSGDGHRVKKDCELVRKHGKVFIAGEFGFFNQPNEYASFLSSLDAAGGAGALVWSLRPSSANGGFKTHGEDGGHWSYHIPGWSQPQHREFDPRESAILQILRTASFKINRERVPSHYPTPSAPAGAPFFVSGGNQGQGTHIAWRAGTWCASYELILRDRQSKKEYGRRQVWDNTKEGQLAIDLRGTELDVGAPRDTLAICLRGVGVDGQFGPESEELLL